MLCPLVGFYLDLPGGISCHMPSDVIFLVAHAQCDCLWNTGLSFFPMEITVLGVAGVSDMVHMLICMAEGWVHAGPAAQNHPHVHIAFTSVHNSQTRPISFNRVAILFDASVYLNIVNSLLTMH